MGAVPIYDENSSGINAFRNLESDVYKFIEMDLEDAVEKLTDESKSRKNWKILGNGYVGKSEIKFKKI